MTRHAPVKQLYVYRRLTSGAKVLAGQLAQNAQGVYFQYEPDYIDHYHNLSPFKLPFETKLTKAPKIPHAGLHGLFSDSLPDGWGLLLMDRVFRRHDIPPHALTVLDRLAYVGDHGMGALGYAPISTIGSPDVDSFIDIAKLGDEAEALYEGTTDEVLPQLAAGGSSAGARPKSQIYIDPKHPARVSTTAKPGLEPWLIKFTANQLMLGHEEGLCEAAYLSMAREAGIDVPEWQLIQAPAESQAIAWLATRRFDCTPNNEWLGRYHVHSLCGLLDADFRQPTMDYVEIIKMSQVLCRRPAVGQQQFKRALFNLFAGNQDDHSKNCSFIMDDKGEWNPSPVYDVTFSPTPFGEHATAFGGYGKMPSLNVIQQLAHQANFKDWSQARQVVQAVVEAIQQWGSIASELGVSNQTQKLVGDHLNVLWKENRLLSQ